MQERFRQCTVTAGSGVGTDTMADIVVLAKARHSFEVVAALVCCNEGL
jgi:hypothetical protein